MLIARVLVLRWRCFVIMVKNGSWPLSSLSALLPFTLKHNGTKRPWRWAGEEQQHLFPQTNNVGESEGRRSGVTGSRQVLVISRLAAPISWVNEELLPCSGRWWVWQERDENRQGRTPMQALVDNVQGKKCQNSSKCICLWWTPSNTRLQYEDLFPQEKKGGIDPKTDERILIPVTVSQDIPSLRKPHFVFLLTVTIRINGILPLKFTPRKESSREKFARL